ncbi:MAG TPA: hypothetical protein VGD71_13505 [Kribbella sp.]
MTWKSSSPRLSGGPTTIRANNANDSGRPGKSRWVGSELEVVQLGVHEDGNEA